MMTRTEQLEAAWNVLQCRELTRAMLDEVNAMPDLINCSLVRLKECSDIRIHEEKQTKMTSLAQQMSILGICTDELALHIQQLQKPQKKERKSTPALIVANVDGVIVKNRGRLPQSFIDKGWRNYKEIPEQYWTDEYREIVAAQ